MADYLRRPGDSERSITETLARVREERREVAARLTRRIEEEPIAHNMGEAAMVARLHDQVYPGGIPNEDKTAELRGWVRAGVRP
jgi:hypothetical protein